MNLPEIQSFTIQNKSGISLTVLNYGAIIQKLFVFDKDNKPVNIVIGYPNPEDYRNNPLYIGACIGAYAGRISNGEFALDETSYTLYNEDGVHLHGGRMGFDQRIWTVDELVNGDESYIKLSYVSKDMEEGYPGNVKIEVAYKLTEDNTLKITHTAITDATTILNVTNHSYFNLGGTVPIDNHELYIKASNYLELNENLTPTGAILKVKNSDYNFLKKKKIEHLRIDDTFIFDNAKEGQISLYAENTGIEMTVTTNQPAVVVFIPKTIDAICLETQNFPDAPNHKNFPSAVLNVGDTYCNESIFKFKIS